MDAAAACGSDLLASVSSTHRGRLFDFDSKPSYASHFVASYRFISAAMRSRPAFTSASAWPLSQWHLARFRDIFCRSRIPITCLGLTAESTNSRNIRLFFILDVAYDRFAYMTHKVSQ
jgi:hypothetical protein